MMEDVIIDLEDEVVDEIVIDELIDASDVIIDSSYNDGSVKRRVIRHDAYNRPINDKPSDFVSFRYSRYDRDSVAHIIHNPVSDMFVQVQQEIDDIAKSSMSDAAKRDMVVKIVNRFKQYLRSKNIRYRNLWRNLDNHGIIRQKQIW